MYRKSSINPCNNCKVSICPNLSKQKRFNIQWKKILIGIFVVQLSSSVIQLTLRMDRGYMPPPWNGIKDYSRNVSVTKISVYTFQPHYQSSRCHWQPPVGHLSMAGSVSYTKPISRNAPILTKIGALINFWAQNTTETAEIQIWVQKMDFSLCRLNKGEI